MNCGAILLAGGSSRRMEGRTDDKTLWNLGNRKVLQYSLNTFLDSELCKEIVIVHRDEKQLKRIQKLIPEDNPTIFTYALGGEERMHSVHNGLKAFRNPPEIVFIHDTARPFISIELLQVLKDSALKYGAACPAAKVTDTLKRSSNENPSALVSVPRESLWAMQTPQTFQYQYIFEAYQHAIQEGISLTDDTSALEITGQKVHILENPSPNPKLTTPSDLPWFEFLLQSRNKP